MAEVLAGRERESFAEVADIDEFVATLERFERGEISPDAWRKFRLVRGTYGQRQDDRADAAGEDSAGRADGAAGRVARRRVVAVRARLRARHDPSERPVSFPAAERRRGRHAAYGRRRASRRARPAATRSATSPACPFAGVSADEVFDVTPYAEALTRFLLRHPLAAVLPRKFKIAFEGCADDHAFASINDLGWIARIEERDGKPVRGFRLTVGGGTSILPVSGRALVRVSAGERHVRGVGSYPPRVSPARRSRASSAQPDEVPDQDARLGSLARRSARDARGGAATNRCRAAIRSGVASGRAGARLARPTPPSAARDPCAHRGGRPTRAGHSSTRSARVRRRGARSTRGVRPTCGRSGRRVMRWRSCGCRWATSPPVSCVPSRCSRRHSATARCVSRRIRTSSCAGCRSRASHDLFVRLAAAGLATAGASTIADVTSCPGAESCKLAVTQSRGLGRSLTDTLAQRPDLTALAARRLDQDQRLSRTAAASITSRRWASRAACARSMAAPCRSTS